MPEVEAPPEPVPPRVFVSYSHDSPGHKRRVAELAGRLMDKGIEIILDQWDLSLGADLGQYMERLATADRVLVVCTPIYCRKANEGSGGVGYEKQILTQELVRDTQTDKFIPVIFEGTDGHLTPTCLGGRLYIDMRPGTPPERLDDLMADIHRQPSVTKPKLGKNPFAATATGAATAPTVTTTLLPTKATNLDPVAVYEQGVLLARAKDNIGWRHLARDVRTRCLKALLDAREGLDQLVKAPAADEQERRGNIMDAGLKTVAPLFALAFAGVESGDPTLEHQEAVLDDIVNVAGWNRAGWAHITTIPHDLGFIFHYLHGAMAMSLGRIDLALGLARSTLSIQDYGGQRGIVANNLNLTGWARMFESHVFHSWQYFEGYVKRAPWIAHVFGSPEDAFTAIAAYGYVLTLDECASSVASHLKVDPRWKPEQDSFADIRLNVPAYFLVDEEPAPQRGYQLFMRCRENIPGVWRRFKIPDDIMTASWSSWIVGTFNWFGKVRYRLPILRTQELVHTRLLEELVIA